MYIGPLDDLNLTILCNISLGTLPPPCIMHARETWGTFSPDLCMQWDNWLTHIYLYEEKEFFVLRSIPMLGCCYLM